MLLTSDDASKDAELLVLRHENAVLRRLGSRVYPAGLGGARMFFRRAQSATGVTPTEVITDRAPTYPRILDEMWPAAWHHSEQYANNRI